MTQHDFGFVYVATGQSYINEAVVSAQSLRQFHKQPITLITNEPHESAHFDQIIIDPMLPPTVEAKLNVSAVNYNKFIYLDSDTLILAPLDELISILDAFDICVPASLGGYHYTLQNVSPAFREPSTNVIGFRRNGSVDRFFENWRMYYKKYENIMGREWDQRSFRHAAYIDPSLRICFLGDEWSLSPYPGGILCRDVRILHGRPLDLLRRMAMSVNRHSGYRVYWRDFPLISTPSELSFLRSLLLSFAFLRHGFKQLLRPSWRFIKSALAKK